MFAPVAHCCCSTDIYNWRCADLNLDQLLEKSKLLQVSIKLQNIKQNIKILQQNINQKSNKMFNIIVIMSLMNQLLFILVKKQLILFYYILQFNYQIEKRGHVTGKVFNQQKQQIQSIIILVFGIKTIFMKKN